MDHKDENDNLNSDLTEGTETLEEKEEEVVNVISEGEDSSEETTKDAKEDEEVKGYKKLARNKTWQSFWSNLLFMACWFVLFTAIFYVFPPYLVSGDSMNQTLKDKAFGFGLRYSTLEQGDIVVFNNSDTNGQDYIKRVIGVPGDTVEVKGYQIIVNGKALEEDYAYFDPDYRGTAGGPCMVSWLKITDYVNDNGEIVRGYCGSVTLGDNEYFVLGDNRCHSKDSRSIGVIHKSDVKCEMLFFIWGKKR